MILSVIIEIVCTVFFKGLSQIYINTLVSQNLFEDISVTGSKYLLYINLQLMTFAMHAGGKLQLIIL